MTPKLEENMGEFLSILCIQLGLLPMTQNPEATRKSIDNFHYVNIKTLFRSNQQTPTINK